MTGLLARLYLDEDVSAYLAKLLVAAGHDVLTTVDANQLGAADRTQLEFATSHNRTLVTHNRRDFERLVKIYFEMLSTMLALSRFAARRGHWRIGLSMFSTDSPWMKCSTEHCTSENVNAHVCLQPEKRQ